MATTITDPSLDPDESPAAPVAPQHRRRASQRDQRCDQHASSRVRPQATAARRHRQHAGGAQDPHRPGDARAARQQRRARRCSRATRSPRWRTRPKRCSPCCSSAAPGSSRSATLVPLTLGIVALLVILVFSYRQTIKAYPSAGGAYIVTRDNFGVLPAQIAGVALLTDYILTVAVSVSAGVAAMYSAFPAAYPYRVAIAVGLIWIIAWMNLRGREGVGSHLRGADLRVRRLDHRARHRGRREGDHRRTRPDPRAPRRRSPPAPAGRSASSCC